MGACTWKLPITLPNYYQRENQTLLSHDPMFCNFNSRGRIEKFNYSPPHLVVKKTRFMVRGCGCEESSSENDYGETEEDRYFVKVLRESKPYLSIHRARVFVVLISAQLVAHPDYFNAILTVPPLSLSLSLNSSTVLFVPLLPLTHLT
ncbi:unnamed protein product [Vicia faba]|uniref:Uncharacterized protein n=1 Tax=Vicia faba TaxID=3906 RepID=A0AAV0YU23_VICFA|nr:unnamed protein product [Vicia faba]